MDECFDLRAALDDILVRDARPMKLAGKHGASAWTNGRGAAELSKVVHHLMIMYAWLRPFRRLHELFWRGVGLNWANDGFEFVHISRVDVAWRLRDLMGTQSRVGDGAAAVVDNEGRKFSLTPPEHTGPETPPGQKVRKSHVNIILKMYIV